MIKVTIFSTKGLDKKVIETSATTWGELKEEVSEFYDMDNLQATENVNRTDLVHESAVLPTSDFRLFLRPIKTKSGSVKYTYQEARNIISDNKELQEEIKKYYGMNYTNLSTHILNEAITRYSNEEEVKVKDSIAEIRETVSELTDFLEDFLFRLGGMKPNYGATEHDYEEEEEYDEELDDLVEEARDIFGDF